MKKKILLLCKIMYIKYVYYKNIQLNSLYACVI